MVLLTQMGVDLLMVTFDPKIDGWKFVPTPRMDGFMPNRAPFCGSMSFSLYPDSAMLEIARNQQDRSSRILPMPVRLFTFFVVHFVLYHVESLQLLEVEPGGWRRSFHAYQLRRSSRHWAGLVSWSFPQCHSDGPGRELFLFSLKPSIQGYIQRSWCEITFVISAAYHIYQIYYQYKCLCGNNILETGILIFDDSRWINMVHLISKTGWDAGNHQISQCCGNHQISNVVHLKF